MSGLAKLDEVEPIMIAFMACIEDLEDTECSEPAIAASIGIIMTKLGYSKRKSVIASVCASEAIASDFARMFGEAGIASRFATLAGAVRTAIQITENNLISPEQEKQLNEAIDMAGLDNWDTSGFDKIGKAKK